MELSQAVQPVQGRNGRGGEFIGLTEAARLLSVSTRTMASLANFNKLPTRRIKGHKRYWFRRADVLGLLTEPEQPEQGGRA